METAPSSRPWLPTSGASSPKAKPHVPLARPCPSGPLSNMTLHEAAPGDFAFVPSRMESIGPATAASSSTQTSYGPQPRAGRVQLAQPWRRRRRRTRRREQASYSHSRRGIGAFTCHSNSSNCLADASWRHAAMRLGKAGDALRLGPAVRKLDAVQGTPWPICDKLSRCVHGWPGR